MKKQIAPRIIDKAFKAACQARKQAHAPYSRFFVGAALVSGSRIFTGCNMENASYGATLCAERVAFGKAISEGCRRFSDVIVVTQSKPLAPPCGMCLQVMAEFLSTDARIWLANPRRIQTVYKFSELYPQAFTSKDFLR